MSITNTYSKMKTGKMDQLLFLLLVIPCIVAFQADWDCSSPCRCKWMNGKKSAECVRQGLNQIPNFLSSEIQSLDLTGNQISHLHENAFSLLNLTNLHKLYLKMCDVESINTKAFNGLEIVIEIDLSENNLEELHAGTFSETKLLRVLYLNKNRLQKLENGLFDHLMHLQTVHLSDNQIKWIGEKSFHRLPALKTLELNDNNLSNVTLASFEKLPKLSSLELHHNAWNCSCHLKDFRDWTIKRRLYTRPTMCKHPLHLKDKFWDEINSNEFACQPRIKTVIPSARIVQVEIGKDAELNCLASGIPLPRINWVHQSRILNNLTKRSSGNSEKVGYLVQETNGWVNLTIPEVTISDKGSYACVAQSPGGFAEENVTLVILGDQSNGDQIGSHHIMSLPLALGLGVAVLLFFLVAMTLCIFYCRRKQTIDDEKGHHEMGDHHDSLEQHGLGEQQKSLITAINSSAGTATTAVVLKSSSRYKSPSVTSHGTEMTELNRTLLDNDSVFADGIGRITANSIVDNDEDDERGRATPELENETLFRGDNLFNNSTNSRQYPPDLLAFSSGRGCSPTSQASTAPDNSRLLNQHLFGPFGGSPSQQYPNGGFKTLPHNRSGTPFTSVVASGASIPILPRQGYVTIPRRPRAPSWSSGPPISPVEVVGAVEPVYDNLGLRTTADGSSVISLNKSPEPSMVASIRSGRPLPAPPSSHNAIQRSTPNILSNNNNNNSSNIDNTLDRSAPEGAAEWPVQLDEEMENCDKQLALGSLGRKVPPRPPPKPKKKNANGPLYEDEGEDGTEV